MKIIVLILVGILTFLIGLTSFFYKKQKKLRKKGRKGSKYEVVEISELDQRYHDYYEPQIVEVISSEEYL